MSPVDCTSMEPPVGTELVALQLPPTTPPPEPARRIGFVKALLFYWIVPGRLGPHLAVDTWRRAIAAHVIALVCAGTVVWHVAADWEDGLLRDLTSLHEVRKMLAIALLNVTNRGFGVELETMKVGAALFFTFVIESMPVLVAGCFLLRCADGDDGKSVGRRCFKNGYWATTILIPVAVLYWVTYALLPDGEGLNLRRLNQQLPLSAQLGFIMLALFLVLRMLVLGAGRYVGKAVGPGFAPREPLCGQCGYRITGLPVVGQCPECGAPVRDSLPGGKRRPTTWQRQEFTRQSVAALIRMQGRVIRDPAFLETVPVHEGLSSARRFRWGTLLLMIPVMLGTARGMDLLLGMITGGCADTGAISHRELLMVLALLVAQTVVILAAVQWGETWLKIKDCRVSAVVCYYALPLMWPLALLAPPTAVVVFGRLDQVSKDEWLVPMLGVRLTVNDTAGIVLGLIALGALGFLYARLCRGLRAARYANV